MDKLESVISDAELEAAFTRAKLHDDDPVAQTVTHESRLNLLIINLSNRRRLVIPVEEIQGLERATPAQMKHYELLGGGTGISFPDIDADLYVPALIEGIYGNKRWMAQLGSKGGAARTEAKRTASRANGAKGGRPRKPVALEA